MPLPSDQEILSAWLHGLSPATQDAYRRDVLQFLGICLQVGPSAAPASLVDTSLEHVQRFDT